MYKKTSDVAGLLLLLSILVKGLGIKGTIKLLYQMLKMFNVSLVHLANTSVFSVAFKYLITFPIVGLVLYALGSPRGKKGRIIGKISYCLVGYVVCLLLDYIAINIL